MMGSGEHSLYYQVRLDPWFERVKVNQDMVRGMTFVPQGEIIRPKGREGQGQPGQVRERSLSHQVRLSSRVERVKVN